MTNTKKDLETYLANKGPGFIINYLSCYYKKINLFKETNLLKALLKKMSFQGQERFLEQLKSIQEFDESTSNDDDQDYFKWCEENSKDGFSNKEQSMAALNPENSQYKRITLKNDFFQNCKIQVQDKVRVKENHGYIVKDTIGTVEDYRIGDKIGKHFLEVGFRFVDPVTQDLIDYLEYLIPLDELETEERWDSVKEQYTKKFKKEDLAYPDYEPLNLGTLYDNLDKEMYDYPITFKKKITDLLKKVLKK